MQLVNSISYTTSGPASSEVAVSLGPGQTVLRGWGGVVVGLEKRGGGSSVFETLVRGGGGSSNFQLPTGVTPSIFNGQKLFDLWLKTYTWLAGLSLTNKGCNQ